MRRELGPDAAVLHTREVRGRWLGLLPGPRQIEVTASRGINVPSRLPTPTREEPPADPPPPRKQTARPCDETRLTHQVQGQLSTLQAMVKDLCRHSRARATTTGRGIVPALHRSARRRIERRTGPRVGERVHNDPRAEGLSDAMMLKAHVAGMIEEEIHVAGPIQITPGRCRLAALVGPTGVGKTTTIAKLAANFRLKEKRRVGLITVDTYRIAAVEQLRTYAISSTCRCTSFRPRGRCGRPSSG